MAYKTTTAISANKANGRTADEGIESCSPYWITTEVRLLTRQVEEPFLWFQGFFLVCVQPQTTNAIIAAKKTPSATLSSMVLSVAHRHCCIRQAVP